ncbi:MAG: NAD(+)/NADH kinase [Acidobacteria bacterium]|nr:NAD(+)/NADH kinase [Acidobacteriota bacterium]
MTTSVFRLPPRTVGVVVKHSSPDAVSLGLRVLDELARRGVAGLVDAESAGVLGMPAGPPRASLGRHVDVVLVLGGDGTFLSAAHECPASTPIAGVNLGFLGFLTEHAPARTFELLEAILAGNVEIEQRARLQVKVEGGDEDRSYQVVNDVVVTKAALARIVTVCVEVEGELLSRYRGDGLILSTPTGSTAYNLSAGGPIVHPALAAYLITPICPHTLSNRPLAIPTDLRSRVWVEPGAVQAYLTLDGQIGFPLAPHMRVIVGPSGEPLSVIRDATSSFFSILHHKLKWGDREG